MPKHEVYLNENGQVEFLDLETGEIFRKEISLQELADYTRVNGRWVPNHQVDRPPVYNSLKGLEIANMILDGLPIREICKLVGIDYRIYVQWKSRYAEFRELCANARADRAEEYFEKIEAAVEEAGPDSEEVALARLKVDTYKHLSGTLDPRFNSKVSIDAKVGIVPISIETGIRRTGDDGFKEAPVFGVIEEGQKEIALQEMKSSPTVVLSRPEGSPISDEEIDKIK